MRGIDLGAIPGSTLLRKLHLKSYSDPEAHTPNSTNNSGGSERDRPNHQQPKDNKRMTTTMKTQQPVEHLGESKAVANHDHDMIHELSKRIDAVWKFDQYIANAEEDEELQQFWGDLKNQEQENVRRLKQLVAKHIASDCF